MVRGLVDSRHAMYSAAAHIPYTDKRTHTHAHTHRQRQRQTDKRTLIYRIMKWKPRAEAHRQSQTHKQMSTYTIQERNEHRRGGVKTKKMTSTQQQQLIKWPYQTFQLSIQNKHNLEKCKMYTDKDIYVCEYIDICLCMYVCVYVPG